LGLDKSKKIDYHCVNNLVRPFQIGLKWEYLQKSSYEWQ